MKIRSLALGTALLIVALGVTGLGTMILFRNPEPTTPPPKPANSDSAKAEDNQPETPSGESDSGKEKPAEETADPLVKKPDSPTPKESDAGDKPSESKTGSKTPSAGSARKSSQSPKPENSAAKKLTVETYEGSSALPPVPTSPIDQPETTSLAALSADKTYDRLKLHGLEELCLAIEKAQGTKPAQIEQVADGPALEVRAQEGDKQRLCKFQIKASELHFAWDYCKNPAHRLLQNLLELTVIELAGDEVKGRLLSLCPVTETRDVTLQSNSEDGSIKFVGSFPLYVLPHYEKAAYPLFLKGDVVLKGKKLPLNVGPEARAQGLLPTKAAKQFGLDELRLELRGRDLQLIGTKSKQRAEGSLENLSKELSDLETAWKNCERDRLATFLRQGKKKSIAQANKSFGHLAKLLETKIRPIKDKRGAQFRQIKLKPLYKKKTTGLQKAIKFSEKEKIRAKNGLTQLTNQQPAARLVLYRRVGDIDVEVVRSVAP